MKPQQSTRWTTPVVEVVSTATGSAHRDDPVSPGTGGPAGNARLTAWLGLVLLVLFIVEVLTLISLDATISIHVLVGAALVPLVLLKTATTGWRILRYYFGSVDYRTAGPPPLLLRLLGPLVVLTSLAVLGSGLALIALGDTARSSKLTIGGFTMDAVGLHKVSFVVWLVVTGLHALLRLVPAAKLVGSSPAGRDRVPGGTRRAWLLSGTAALAVAVGVVVLSFAGAWTD
ncbi:MAG: hypothetical protein QOJ03_960 [Frankiaceae bacterium]|jgi:hypothetical protein|nr:hypothetical protein [Frankiaceae bacterium]